MTGFFYQGPFPHAKDEHPTPYKQLQLASIPTADLISLKRFGEREILVIKPEALTLLANAAFHDVGHFLRPQHLTKLAAILADDEASDNDQFVATTLLENAIIAAEGIFPSCQDTGTAIIMGKKGENVWVEADTSTGAETGVDCDEKALSLGVARSFSENNFRYSQVAPLSMFEEKNTGTNLPAQIDLYAVKGNEYHFLFLAKGGGSANKTYLFQKTKALLNPTSLEQFFKENIASLGTAACPPYHLAIAIGGTSAEANLKAVKLASAGYYDDLPTKGNVHGQAFRDLEMEAKVLTITQNLGIGAQFGGKYFCHDVKIIRLPRHGASCPVGMGVSCSADRNIKGKITKDGIFLEQLETNPARFLPVDSLGPAALSDKKTKGQAKVRAKTPVVAVDLSKGMENLRKTLTQYPIKTRLTLTGKIVVARDIAHAKLKEWCDAGKKLPDYFCENIIYYAPIFQAQGASLVMLAKGNRTKIVTESCKKYGGFYLGSIGGPAAQLGRNCITEVKTIEFPELGMEAIFEISVLDFPAFIIVDDKGNDFFAGPL
jgi:fumarate hydratase class I